MKQDQSELTQDTLFGDARYYKPAVTNHTWPKAYLRTGVEFCQKKPSWSWADTCLNTLAIFGYLIVLPARLTFRLIAWLGRFAAILLGFCLMVIGVAIWVGPLFFVGIVFFFVGLTLTLKSLN
jgi:hypothetical protein